MAKSDIKFNLKTIELSLAKHIEAASLPVARDIARERFSDALDTLVAEIEQDPVSQEIMAGPELNTSKFIRGKGTRKYGANLFSFIGFESGSNPVGDLINFITNNSKINLFNVKLVNKQYKFRATLPTEGEIKENNPFPDNVFGSRSWITGVEKGISNAINYIRKIGYGRSGGGIQIDGDIGKVFTPRKNYFSEKYRRFLAKLKG